MSRDDQDLGDRKLEVISLDAPPASSPELEAWHTTRFASPRHRAIGDRAGAPWHARFDWVLDAPLSRPPSSGDETVLTQFRGRPRTVFCKSGRLRLFLDRVMPRLDEPVTVYVGNSNVPLSQEAGDASRIVPDPRIRAFFCENKDLDIADVRAMPVGLHPTDLLQEGGAHRLGQFSQVPATARRPTVFLVDPSPLSAPDKRLVLEGLAGSAAGRLRVFESAELGGRHERWRRQSACRFALADWGRGTASFDVFETLALGSIAIVPEGPLSEAYAGLPVVPVRSLDEITPGNLERWWHEYSPRLRDRRWLDPGFWWRRIVRTLPSAKRAFLVVGPESHGTHLVTDLLVHAGCQGHSGDHGPWRGDGAGSESAGPADRQPWDDSPPTDQDPIVWRRSVPHLRRWPDLHKMAVDLEMRGYRVHVVVVTRERYPAIQSQLKWRHVEDGAQATANIERAYRHIFGHIEAADVTSTVVSYEALVADPKAQDRLLAALGLDAPPEPLELWDGNRKWTQSWTPPDIHSPSTDPGFPEHWYPPPPDAWVRESKAALEGRQAMAEKRVVFCGLARNVAAELPRVIGHIERAGRLFLDYRVAVFENDSEDGTVDLLRDWARRNHRVAVHTESFGWPKWRQDQSTERMAAMAVARNRVLDAVAELVDVDHVVVLDLDLPKGFSLDGLASTFNRGHWDVVGSNSLWVPPTGPPPPRPWYFDTWAYRPREDFGSTSSPEASEADAPPLVFERGEPWVPVVSCFGGLAVYTFEAFTCGARYAGPECEHVAFHHGLRRQGFDRIFLNPSQIVLYAGPESDGDREPDR
ncbi:MAG: hypothetical protein AAGM22_30575 [Acidobacteriota bacterium]